jgi:hypothetical protein
MPANLPPPQAKTTRTQQLQDYIILKTMKTLFPSIKSWLTRQGIKYTGIASVAVAAFLAGKTEGWVVKAQELGASPEALEQLRQLIEQGSGFISFAVVAGGALALELILSFISTKLKQ